MSYVDKLLGIKWEDLPVEVQRHSKRCLKDVIATCAGGITLPGANKALELISSQYAQGKAPLWFTGQFSSNTGAAYFNALTIDSLDWHDGFRLTKGHAGATVVPAVVGLCAQAPITGEELLTSIVLGYEIACRAGLTVHCIYEPAYHSSGSWASLGAAASGARVMRIAAEDIDGILGVAEYYSPMSPMLRCTTSPGTVKDGAAAGAWASTMALEMHQYGMHGLPSLFTAEQAGREYINTLGDDWMILKQYFKPYPTCRWAQPAVECVVYLKNKYNFRHQDIETIHIETFKESATLGKFPPEHCDGAQYSIKWVVAAMLVDGQLGPEQIHPLRLADVSIVKMGHRIQTHIAEDIQKRFPDECLSRVSIELKDGQKLSSPTMSARGDYTNPLDEKEINEKFQNLVGNVLGSEKSREFMELIDNMEDYYARDLLAYLARTFSKEGILDD